MTKDQQTKFRRQLREWFNKNKRDLPWRKDSHWYKTYLSEVILQQTTVDQGLPYFEKFLNVFPSIDKLAVADEHTILHLWAGLGYYSRARNLLKAAKTIMNDYNGHFPDTYEKAVKIPGIGPYSASAILSIAFGKAYAAVDGNVIRVICRLFAIKEDTRQTITQKAIKKKALQLLDKDHPGDFNEALMELGATVCLPKNPQCNVCPLQPFCMSFKRGITKEIPYRSAAKTKQKKYHIVCIMQKDQRILIVRNPQKGLLAGMWGLPVFEVNQKEFENGLDSILGSIGITAESKSTIFRHIYSHIDLKYKAITTNNSAKSSIFNPYIDLQWIELKDAENYAIHNAHKKVFEWYKDTIKNQIPGKYIY